MAACRLSSGIPYCQLDDDETHEALKSANNQCNFESVWMYSFFRIFENSHTGMELVNGVQSSDLVHAVAGLYASTLQSMELETIYDGLERKDSFTIVFYADSKVALEHVKHRTQIKKNAEQSKKKHLDIQSLKSAMERSIKEGERATRTTECEVELVKISGKKVAQSVKEDSGEAGRNEVAESSSDEENEFHMVYSSEFSSTDSETQPSSTSSSVKEDSARQKTDTGSNNSDELNLMSGYQQFIGGCLYRKMLLEDSLIDSSVESQSDRTSRTLNLLGIEHKLMGAVTFRIRYLRKTRRIVHIIFLAIRHHWREKHLGTMLIKLVKDTQIVGPYDAIVVHADIGAESFFSRLGFTENLLLNQQWSEVAEEYINCRLMTFVPGLSSVDRPVGKCFPAEQDVNHVWLTKLDHELETCVKRTEQTHCANLLLYRRLREELITLKTSVSNQTQLICDLSKELRACYQRRLRHIRWRQKRHYDSIPVEGERIQTSDLVSSATETRISKRIHELERLLIELTKDSTLVSVPDVISLAEAHDRGDNQTACNNDNGAYVTATASEVEKSSDEYDSLTESDDDSDNGDNTQSFGHSCDGAENTESVKINIVGEKDIGYRRKNRRIRKQPHKLCSSSLL